MIFVKPGIFEKLFARRSRAYVYMPAGIWKNEPMDFEEHEADLKKAIENNHAFYDHTAERWYVTPNGAKWVKNEIAKDKEL